VQLARWVNAFVSKIISGPRLGLWHSTHWNALQIATRSSRQKLLTRGRRKLIVDLHSVFFLASSLFEKRLFYIVTTVTKMSIPSNSWQCTAYRRAHPMLKGQVCTNTRRIRP
jgi:hypothetical protein